MTHACALVVLPPGGDEGNLSRALAPHHEDRGGWWDWWRRAPYGYSSDELSPAEVLAERDDGGYCWTIVVPGELVLHREIYHPDRRYPECFEPVPDFDERVERVLRSVHPDSRVVVVDYHC